MDASEKLREMAAEQAERSRRYYEGFLVDYVTKETESPIEAIMFYQLLLWSHQQMDDVNIFPQTQIGNYRVDFLVECNGKTVIIECDGHDFHEKTKQQAARDKKRDRELAGLGHEIRRYTGSEIYHDSTIVEHDLYLIFDEHYREWTLKKLKEKSTSRSK